MRKRAEKISTGCILFTALLCTEAGLLVSGFLLRPRFFLLFFGLICLSLFFSWFYRERGLNGKRIPLFLGILVLWLILCYLAQDSLKQNLLYFYDQAVNCFNRAYNAEIKTVESGSSQGITLFLLALFFWMAAVQGILILRSKSMTGILAVVFPYTAVLFLFGGRPDSFWLFALVLVGAGLISGSRSKISGWKGAGTVCFFILVLALPSQCAKDFFPENLHDILYRTRLLVETRLTAGIHKALPVLSGGRLNLSLEGAGGGVENGNLKEAQGYRTAGVDDLKITCSERPEETVYLKAYIGETYTGTSFEKGNEEVFRDTSRSWYSEGDPSLYIQNLPFLRMMYYENSGNTDQKEKGTVKIQVERLEADEDYTYVPYYTFLNDYYEIEGGDGAVKGQNVQEDEYAFFWKKEYGEQMSQIRDQEKKNSILDQTEASYRAYCLTHDLELPESVSDRLEKQCREKMEEEKWDAALWIQDVPDWQISDQIREIRSYVTEMLLKNCEYSQNTTALPDNRDFVDYFLYETKQGNSIHFAAAATVMFRVLGVPSRYVSGYVAPPEMFIDNGDGSWTAVLQDDSAHAWTEIYLPFEGWSPVEVTPGRETEEKHISDSETEPVKNEKKAERETAEKDKTVRLLSWISGMSGTFMKYIGGACFLGGILWILYRMKKRTWILKEPDDKIKKEYISLYRFLVKKGMEENCSVTGEERDGFMEFVRSHCLFFGEEEMERLTSLMEQVNYSSKKADEAEVLWIKKLSRKVHKEFRKKSK